MAAVDLIPREKTCSKIEVLMIDQVSQNSLHEGYGMTKSCDSSNSQINVNRDLDPV